MNPQLDDLEAITLDFGNTLVPVEAHGLRNVVRLTAERLSGPLGPFSVDAFLAAWAEERERQFREEVPHFREVDLAVRLARVLARLRGLDPPPAAVSWDDADAATRSTAEEIERGVAVYSAAFVESIPVPASTAPALARLAARYRLAVLSNWPLASTVDRFVEAAGWDRWLDPILVSQRIGTIKPHPAIFAAALEALGRPRPERVLHVGDDWAADVTGARRAGWRAAWVTHRPADSPLPWSDRDMTVAADLEVGSLTELADVLTPLRTTAE